MLLLCELPSITVDPAAFLHSHFRDKIKISLPGASPRDPIYLPGIPARESKYLRRDPGGGELCSQQVEAFPPE